MKKNKSRNFNEPEKIMMDESRGFDYYLSKETIRKFQEKSPELRLEWLYQGNLLRKKYPKKVINLHNEFREGKR